jgi:hypothetical protein
MCTLSCQKCWSRTWFRSFAALERKLLGRQSMAATYTCSNLKVHKTLPSRFVLEGTFKMCPSKRCTRGVTIYRRKAWNVKVQQRGGGAKSAMGKCYNIWWAHNRDGFQYHNSNNDQRFVLCACVCVVVLLQVMLDLALAKLWMTGRQNEIETTRLWMTTIAKELSVNEAFKYSEGWFWNVRRFCTRSPFCYQSTYWNMNIY